MAKRFRVHWAEDDIERVEYRPSLESARALAKRRFDAGASAVGITEQVLMPPSECGEGDCVYEWLDHRYYLEADESFFSVQEKGRN